MKRAIIFANGNMDVPPNIQSIIDATDLIIAADGGTHHCKSLGLMPDVIIGDFDSLASTDIIGLRQSGAEIVQYPTRKNETDLELAIQYSSEQGITEIIIFGGLGARWDMTIANILLSVNPKFSHLKISLLDGGQEISLLRGEEELLLHGNHGNQLSLIPIAGDVHGITTYGLEYPLDHETLYFGSSRGVSNSFSQETAQVSIEKGLLLCIVNETK